MDLGKFHGGNVGVNFRKVLGLRSTKSLFENFFTDMFCNFSETHSRSMLETVFIVFLFSCLRLVRLPVPVVRAGTEL